MVSVWAGFQACSWNSDGHVVMRSMTIAGSKRTRSPSTSAPASASRLAGLRVEEVHPDLGEDPQRRLVDRLQLVGRHDLGRRVAQPGLGEWPLFGEA